AKMINLKQAFPNAWNQLINSTSTSRNITFKVTDDQVLPDLHVSLKGVLVQLKIADGVSAVSGTNLMTLQVGYPSNTSLVSSAMNFTNNFGSPNNASLTTNQLGPIWNLIFASLPTQILTGGKIDETKLEDIVVTLIYDTNFHVTQTIHLNSSNSHETFVASKIDAAQNINLTFDAATSKYNVDWNHVPGNNGYQVRLVDEETKSIVAGIATAQIDATSTQFVIPAAPGNLIAQVMTEGVAGQQASDYANSASVIRWTAKQLFFQPMISLVPAATLPTAPNGLQLIQLDNSFQALKWLNTTYYFYRNVPATDTIRIIAYDAAGINRREINKNGISNITAITTNASNKTIVLTGSTLSNTPATVVIAWDELNVDKTNFWNFDLAANNVVPNMLGSITGAYTSATLEPAGRTTTSGNAMRLSGDPNNYISFGSGIGQFGTRDFTIGLWMKTTDVSLHNSDIMGNRTEGSAGNFICVRMIGTHPTVPTGSISTEICENTSGLNHTAVESFASTIRVTDGLWHHVTVTRRESTLSLYLDGVFIGSRTSTAPTNIANSRDFRIGQSYAIGSRFTPNAAYDELFICERALSVTEINQYLL
ncbi:MAG: LamG domain-containing protein, partial [Bacteroidia bacterium]